MIRNQIMQLRWGVRRGRRWLRQRFSATALILMYHRVIDVASDPQLLAVSPRHFAEHLEAVRRQARPVPLAQLVRDVRDGRLRDRAVVITFDDGYADNLFGASQLLERFDVPATVFVTAGHIGSAREFWWDELDRLLLQPSVRPETLTLRLAGSTRQFSLNGTADYDSATFERYRDWHIERPHDPTYRQRTYRSLYSMLHALSPAERETALDELRVWAGEAPEGRASHRTLSVDELRALADCRLVEIGGHTMSHPRLGSLPMAAQREEILGSRRLLEEALGQPIVNFAYPFGSATRETAALVNDAGYESACSSRPDVVWPGADLLLLPRVVVRDVDGDAFTRMLRYWLDG